MLQRELISRSTLCCLMWETCFILLGIQENRVLFRYSESADPVRLETRNGCEVVRTRLEYSALVRKMKNN